jgi:hypothetical protein
MKILAPVFILLFALGTLGQTCAPERGGFINLPVAEKIALWNAHLLNYVDEHVLTLNPEQIQVIERARTGILPTIYTEAGDYSAWRKQLRAHFSLRQGAEIFERLPNYRGADLLTRDCNCSSTWTFCDGDATCETSCGSCSCTKIIDCGPFWAFQCNGRCMWL